MSHLFQVLSFSIVFLFFSCSSAKYGKNYGKKPAPSPRTKLQPKDTNSSSNEQILYDTPMKQICNKASLSECVQESEIVYAIPVVKHVQILENTSDSSDSGCCSVFNTNTSKSTNDISLIKNKNESTLTTIRLNTNSKILVTKSVAQIYKNVTCRSTRLSTLGEPFSNFAQEVPPQNPRLEIPEKNKKRFSFFQWDFSDNLKVKQPNHISKSNHLNLEKNSLPVEEHVEPAPQVSVGFFRMLLNCACCIPLPKLETTK